jgi:hypothetical protein
VEVDLSAMVLMESWHATVSSHGVEPIRQVLKEMAQPHTGPQGSGQAAVPPDSDDEGDDGSRISCAAVSATALENIDCSPDAALQLC